MTNGAMTRGRGGLRSLPRPTMSGLPPFMDPAEYPKLAAVEDTMWYFRALHALARGALERELPAETPAEILDAGCGTGGLIRRLSAAHPAWRWSGVDLSPIACALARQRVGADVKISE